jgi:hypothetical protein
VNLWFKNVFFQYVCLEDAWHLLALGPWKARRGWGCDLQLSVAEIASLFQYIFFPALVLSKIEGFYNIWWRKYECWIVFTLDSLGMPEALLLYKGNLGICGRSMCVLCPCYCGCGAGFKSQLVTAVGSLNVQNGFWCSCVGQPNLLELYNIVAFMVPYPTRTLCWMKYLGVMYKKVTVGGRELDKVQLHVQCSKAHFLKTDLQKCAISEARTL